MKRKDEQGLTGKHRWANNAVTYLNGRHPMQIVHCSIHLSLYFEWSFRKAFQVSFRCNLYLLKRRVLSSPTEHSFQYTQHWIMCLITSADCWLRLIQIRIILENSRHISGTGMHHLRILINFLVSLNIEAP